MTPPWPVDAIVHAAREVVLRRGRVTRFARDPAVEADGGHLRITFAWRKSPTPYGLRIPLPGDPPESPWTGVPLDSPDEYASDLAGLLDEELHTGFVRRARRIPRDGWTELEYPAPWPLGRSEFYVTTGRSRARDLIARIYAMTNDDDPRELGRTSVSWGPSAAELGPVDVRPGAPAGVFAALVLHAVHDAADAGAAAVVAGDPGLAALGFSPAPGGGWVMATAEAPPVPVG